MELIKFLTELKNNKYVSLNQLENDINKLKKIVDNPKLKFDYVKPKRLKNYINDLRETTESSAAKVRDFAEKSFRYAAETIPKFKPKFDFEPKTDDDIYLLLGFLLSMDNLDDFDFDFNYEDELLALIGMLLINNLDDPIEKLKESLEEIIDNSKNTNDPINESPSDTIARLASIIRQKSTESDERYEIMKTELETLKGAVNAAKIIESLYDLDKERLQGKNQQITALQSQLDTTKEQLETIQTTLDATRRQALTDKETSASKLDETLKIAEDFQKKYDDARAQANAAAEAINKIQNDADIAIAAAEAIAAQEIAAAQGESQGAVDAIRDAQARADAAISAARDNYDKQIADAMRIAANAESAANQAAENAASAQAKAQEEHIKSVRAIAAATEATTAAQLSKAQLELVTEAVRIAQTQTDEKNAITAAQIALYTSNIATLEAQNTDLTSQITSAQTDINRYKNELQQARVIALGAEKNVELYIAKNAILSLERDKTKGLVTNATTAKNDAISALAAAQKSQVAAQNAEAVAVANLQVAKDSKSKAEERARAVIAAKVKAEEDKQIAEGERNVARSSQQNAEERAVAADNARLLAEKKTKETEEAKQKTDKAYEDALAKINETLKQTQDKLDKMIDEKTQVSKNLGQEIDGYTKKIEDYKRQISNSEKEKGNVLKTNEEMGNRLAELNNELQKKDEKISKIKMDYKHDHAIYMGNLNQLTEAQLIIAEFHKEKMNRLEIIEKNTELELELEKRSQSIKTLQDKLDELSVKYLVSVAESETATMLLRDAIGLFPNTVVKRAREDSVTRAMDASARKKMEHKWDGIIINGESPATNKYSLTSQPANGRAAVSRIERTPLSATGRFRSLPPISGHSRVITSSSRTPISSRPSAITPTNATDNALTAITPIPRSNFQNEQQLGFGFKKPFSI